MSTDTVTTAKREFMERAAGKFMYLRVKVKRWEGVKRSRAVAEAAAAAGGAESSAVNGSVNLMGQHHADLKRVKAANAKINTYLYERALPSDIEGEYMFHVDQIPTVLTDLNKLKAAAEQELQQFVQLYSRFVMAAKASLGEYFNKADYPSADEVREKFAISISAPDFVPVADIERFKHLPVAQAADWAAAAEAKTARKIEGAREFILDSIRTMFADMEDKLAKGELRYSAERERKVKHLSTQLRQLVRDWDNHPQLAEMADLIDEKILPATADKHLKEKPLTQAEVRRAAKTVVKGVDSHRKNQERLRNAAVASNKSAAAAGTPVGGMLADLV